MSRPASLTIVTYHHVGPFRPDMPGRFASLALDAFHGQLDYIGRHYQVVSAEQVISALCDDGPLPERPLWLTFDDGYRSQYEHVLPALLARGWQGSFFPVGCATRQDALLDINKIHLVLASVTGPDHLLGELRNCFEAERKISDLQSWDAYRKRLAGPHRFDGPESAFVKRLLQWGLPPRPKARVLDALFRRLVADDERTLARELYMNREDLMAMKDAGMFLGCHTWSHPRLTTLSRPEQEKEMKRSLDFLQGLGVRTDRWVIAYPFGDADRELARFLSGRGCCLGLTIRGEVAQVTHDSPLLLPRIDTNRLPTEPAAAPRRQAVATASGS